MICDLPTALERIRSLGLPRFFELVWQDTHDHESTIPKDLKWFFKSISSPRRDSNHGVAELQWMNGFLPIWVDNSDSMVVRDHDGRFLQFFYEDVSRCHYVRLLGNNYQLFITGILDDMVEAGYEQEFVSSAMDLFEYQNKDEYWRFQAELTCGMSDECYLKALLEFRDLLKHQC